MRNCAIRTERNPRHVTRESTTRSLHFGEFGVRVLRRWPTFLAGFLITVALAVMASTQVPKLYTATTTLVVSPIVANPSAGASAQGTININTEREILGSNEVARLAAEQLGVPFTGSSALLTQTDVAAPSGSQVLQVSVSASDPEDAARYSAAMANAYLEFRRQGAQQLAAAYLAAIDEQIEQLTASGDSSNATLAALADLRDQRRSLELLGSEPGRIVGQAIPPSNPSSLGLKQFLAAGLVGGLLVGLGLVLLRDRLDRHVRYPSRLADATDSQPSVVHGAKDAEAVRWLVREIDLAAPQGEAARLVGLAALRVASAPLREALTAALTNSEEPVVVDGADLSPAEVDRGWPSTDQLTAWAGRTVLVDLGDVHSPTSFARLTAACDVLLVAVAPRARLAEVRRTWSVAAEVGTRTLAAFVTSHSGDHATAPATHGSHEPAAEPRATTDRVETDEPEDPEGTSLVDEVTVPDEAAPAARVGAASSKRATVPGPRPPAT